MRGEGTGASDDQGVEAIWPLALAQKWTPSWESIQQELPVRVGAQRRMKKGTRNTEGPRRVNPHSLSGTRVQDEVVKGGAKVRSRAQR